MKDSCNRNSIGFSHKTLFVLLVFYFIFKDVFAISSRPICHPEQRDSLIEFKNELEIEKPCFDRFLKMESWTKNNSNCCSWDGITCDANFGDVIEVNVSYSCLHGWLSSKSNIFKLHNLHLLDLSSNNLRGEILSSLTNLSHLTYLDLRHNKFSGKIPSSLRNLMHLTQLDLSDNNFVGKITSSLGNCSHLISLGLCANNFVGEIPFSIGFLSHLTHLVLCENSLAGEIPSSFANLSHLTFLDISANHFSGEIPSYFGSFNKLVILSIENNKFSGNFPLILQNLTNLLDLSISNNQLTGMLPPNMSSLSNLEFFYIDHNVFTGTLPSSLFTISSLTYVDVSYNQLNGTLEFGNPSSSLFDLRLGKNNFIGPFPRSIVKFVNLSTLDLSNINIQGLFDFSLFSHFQSLEELDLSDLNTTTTFDLNEIFSYFKSLYSLDLSGNHVSPYIKVSVLDHPLLTQLNLSRCGLTKFPEFLRTQYNLQYFDISNNEIKGQVPGWLWSLSNLTYVDLSNNKFIGFERSMNPRLSSTKEPQLKSLFGANNDFSENIPYIICGLHSLTILDLFNNKFSGSIPGCLGNSTMTLEALILRKNRLTGGFPEIFSKVLISLDLGHNQLVGKLPISLVNISSLEVLNVESNKFNDSFPIWLSSLPKLKVLVLRSNAFHGPIQRVGFSQLRIIDLSSNHFNGTLPSDCFVNWTAMFSLGIIASGFNREYMGTSYYTDSMVLMNKGTEMKLERILNIFTAIDFSGNKFEGEIPTSIGILKELHVLSLSNNSLTGHIPSTMANLIELESLDVSQNKLSGEIPQELGKLSFLSYMNFSHNQLVGSIPGNTQFQTQSCSSFEENFGFFGPTFYRICGDMHKKTSERSETLTQGENEEEVISWIAVAIGFIPGVPFGFMIGYILLSYKSKLFTKTFGRNIR